jgi:thymidylate synthase
MYFPNVWQNLLRDLLEGGKCIAPRGMATQELPQRTLAVNMRKPVLTVPKRNINPRFMAAEAYWILSGDDRVETIAPYNSRIVEFSDDGQVFFGAYGPKVVAQLPYVVNTLMRDPSSRQAGLTIWRENPRPTKDVPCTVALFFGIRDGTLNVHVFMRSSDAWLGVPYDVFNFSMLGHYVCGLLHKEGMAVTPGNLYLTAASSHLYETNYEQARQCLDEVKPQFPTPTFAWTQPDQLMERLKSLRESKPGSELRWWDVLQTPGSLPYNAP